MKIINNKIFFIVLVFLLLIININHIVYGLTEEEQLAIELKQLLDEYQSGLGDLNQFKDVVNKTYNDLHSATTVDEQLKSKLIADINKFEQVDGLDPLILSVLDIELKSQVANLTDENLHEMQLEIAIIKEWTDENIPDRQPSGNTNKPSTNTNTDNIDKTLSGIIPKAGIKDLIIIALVISIIFSITFVIKYKKIKLK